MANKTDLQNPSAPGLLPFPADWIYKHPGRVEESLSQISVEDQIRYAIQLRGKQMMDFINLSPKALEVVRGLSPEGLYQMIKEIGLGEALPVLSLMTENQMQYSFDLEWWHGDRFVPERAREWIELLDKCEDSRILEWFQTDDFDQKVVLLQALIKVFKNDEMTDSYQGVEGLPHFSPDGVYDIFFKIKEYTALKKLLLLLRSENKALYDSLLEAVIWYPVTQTVEKAYRWRLTRTAERGIPDFEEALEIYSRLEPEALKLSAPELEDFAYPEEFNIAPTYPFALAGPTSFFKESISLLENQERLNTLCWEFVYLANKVMVADRVDLSHLEIREEALKKAMGYVNIGLELGASGDPGKGARLLDHTRIQPLFQVGYHQLMTLKWKAESFIREYGTTLEGLFAEFHKEQMTALVDRFPKVAEVEGEQASLSWRNFESLEDVQRADSFLDRWMFHLRLARKGLELNKETLKDHLDECDVPEKPEDADMIVWTNTALARYILFKEISCKPLPEPAAKSFLEIFFLPGVFKEEVREWDPAMLEAFHQALLKLPLAWVETDRAFLSDLLNECALHLQSQFGRLDPKVGIDWRFTHGLCVKFH
ncbi:hypothetical protein UR09_02090 [Candidatus Nitromaritima sp. SCGC AAA799-A02]|nr:hypothetical protein UZ36_04620 [Candidatus Nitromaritima sp. SCGC AAA799-C22]KMP11987.1 hypothetical protein UR09_02090 [Candidatus Nitromaritima sp. SCGC AAA799-A02]